jgi:recombination protein RecR
MSFPPPLARLVDELRKLPGIGSKTAQRLALHLVARPASEAGALAEALRLLHESIRPCSVCRQYTEADPCALCSDTSRDRSVICVVEQPGDVLAIERSGEYRGQYHVLHGALNPLAGIGPESLTVEPLDRRLRTGEVREVVLATNASVEGEATAAWLAGHLRRDGLRLTRPAQGLPAGGDVEYTDRLTLARALRGRREFD